MNKWILISLMGLSCLSSQSLAQMDPGSITYTNPNGSSWNGSDSAGRYVHKPKAKKTKRMVASETPLPTPQPTVVPAVQGQPNIGPRLNEKDVEPAAGTANVPAAPAPTAAPSATPSSPQKQSIGGKVRDLVLGGDEATLENYRGFLDLQDIRKNFLEFTLATGYMYNTSLSSYYFKNYNNSGPVADLGADIWLTPFLGISAEYETTLLNELNDSPTQNIFVSTTQSWFDFGIKFRRFFGMAVNAPSFTLGLRYSNYQMSVPQSSLSRVQLQNAGPELDLDLTMPIGHESFLTMGLMAQPLDILSESSGSAVRSGNGNQTIGMGASLGAEYRLSRQTTGFLKLSSLVYKSDFSGVANTADPVTGSAPSSVPVTNIFYMLNIGLRLGH
jgi:hypothetical protein